MPIHKDEIRRLYQAYAPVIHRRAQQLLRNEDEAWDAVHDVFTKLLDERLVFRREATLMTLVYRMTTNHCLNRIRARRVRQVAVPELRHQAEEAAPALDLRVDASDFLLRLRDALAERGQPERLLAVAVYVHIDEMPQGEVARMLGVSRKTVQRDITALQAVAEELR